MPGLWDQSQVEEILASPTRFAFANGDARGISPFYYEVD